MREEWIAELKAGDTVFTSNKYGSAPDETKVLRVTPTLVIVGRANSLGETYEQRFRKSTGYVVSSDKWTRTYLIQDTTEARNAALCSKLIHRAAWLRERANIPTNLEGVQRFIAAIEPFVSVKQEPSK